MLCFANLVAAIQFLTLARVRRTSAAEAGQSCEQLDSATEAVGLISIKGTMLSIIISIDLCHQTLAILCCNIAALKNNNYSLHLNIIVI
jgi:hypothetical protein